MLVPIIMGSKVDLEVGRAIARDLADFGIESQIRVASAHKATRYLLSMLEAYEEEGLAPLYITIAGRSNALSGVVDASVQGPVIACPPYSDRFGGADIFSSLRLPSGVSPAVVLEPATAALLAAKILSMIRPELRVKVAAYQRAKRDQIEKDDRELVHG